MNKAKGDPNRPYAALLRELMAEGKWSDNALARKLKIPQPNITRLRNGQTADPKPRTVEPIAAFFGLTAEQFLAGTRGIPDKKVIPKPILSVDAVEVAQLWQALPKPSKDLMRAMINREFMIASNAAWIPQLTLDGNYQKWERQIEKLPKDRRSTDKKEKQ